MNNPIKWLLRDPELERSEEKLDKYIGRLREKVQNAGSTTLIEIGVDFPESFTKQSKEIVVGDVEWRDFYSNKSLDLFSLHCKMAMGSLLKEHRHPDFDEYIYVISGSIVNLIDSSSDAFVVAPPEDAKDAKRNVEGWYKIPAGQSHIIRALEDHTHFVMKFLKVDD